MLNISVTTMHDVPMQKQLRPMHC